MSSESVYTCDRCKKEITENPVRVTFECKMELSHIKDGLDLCGSCFLAFVDWVKKTGSAKLGSVERVAKRKSSESRELGPVERVAKREDTK